MLSNREKLSSDKCRDSGLALALVCLIGFQAWKLPILIPAAILTLIAAMTWPPVFRPFARLWFGLSEGLGAVASRVILTALFFLLVLPVGLTRKILGKDPMRREIWKKGNESVFRLRNHRFVGKDLDNPY